VEEFIRSATIKEMIARTNQFPINKITHAETLLKEVGWLRTIQYIVILMVTIVPQAGDFVICTYPTIQVPHSPFASNRDARGNFLGTPAHPVP
jgi:hypothetical protein